MRRSVHVGSLTVRHLVRVLRQRGVRVSRDPKIVAGGVKTVVTLSCERGSTAVSAYVIVSSELQLIDYVTVHHIVDRLEAAFGSDFKAAVRQAHPLAVGSSHMDAFKVFLANRYAQIADDELLCSNR